jgi:hypothetical protein
VGPEADLDRCRKSGPTGIRSPDLLARSESLPTELSRLPNLKKTAVISPRNYYFPIVLPSDLFSSGFSTKTAYPFLLYPLLATCTSSHLVFCAVTPV